MKQSKKIIALASVTLSIIMFWLIPGINTAKDTTYTRIYEDTDIKSAKTQPGDTVRFRKKRPKKLANNKLYKVESIHSTDKLSKVKARMFSRAIQFQEEVEINLDSTKVVELDVMDSIELDPQVQRYSKRQKGN